MSVSFPEGWRIESLSKRHNRKGFDCGNAEVNDWLWTKARQSLAKNLSNTKVLCDSGGDIAGFYTLAVAQVNLGDLPHPILAKLPKRLLPVVVLGWLGVDEAHQGTGLGDRLLADALLRCIDAGGTIPFVAVVVDCLNENAKAFFQRFGFVEFPGRPMSLLIPRGDLESILEV